MNQKSGNVMHFLKTVGKYVGIPVLLLVVGAAIGAGLIIDAGKNFNDDANWFGTPGGIDEADMVSLGGVDQYIRIRGRDRSNPVMLDLHGGPGWPQTGMSYRSLRPLTEYFTLVEWDQRGTVRSPVPDNAPLVTYERMVDDTIELIEHLKQRLDVEKITLVGHSWGSKLGLGVTHKRPDLIAAYVGVGQAVSWKANFDETKRLVINAAEQAGDDETLTALCALPDTWPDKDDFEGILNRIETIQLPLTKYGTSLHASKSNSMFTSDLAHDLLFSPEMELSDAINLLSGYSETTKQLFAAIHDLDIRNHLGSTFEVPIFLFQGAHDWQTPTSLARPWFDTIEAPYKEYVNFEHSAHMIINEQPGKYLHSLVTKVRPFSENGAGNGNP